ncbi:MAG: DNA polymerase III subunit delta', partial [Ardenticatenaceae bacterium]
MDTTLNPWPIIGHELAVAYLSRAIAEDTLAHAYLLTGPEQVGKQTMAQTFAQALLCTAEGNRPCGSCRACHLVQARRHPDFLILDMAWQESVLPDKRSAQSISVDAVRLINGELARRPHEGRWKVLLVPHAEELTVAAANAFLKTLEEPPSFVVILLTARDPDLVLP